MQYLNDIPSFESVKNTIVDAFNQHYPIVKEKAVLHGGRAIAIIHEQALKYPLTTLTAANVALLFIAKITADVASTLLYYLSFKKVPKSLSAPICGAVVLIAGNYGLQMVLKLPLYQAILIPAGVSVTFLAIHLGRSEKKKREAAEAEKKRKMAEELQKIEAELKELRNSIATLVDGMDHDHLGELKLKYKWWDPKNHETLNGRGLVILTSLHRDLKRIG